MPECKNCKWFGDPENYQPSKNHTDAMCWALPPHPEYGRPIVRDDCECALFLHKDYYKMPEYTGPR
jgi:hypothetical protein